MLKRLRQGISFCCCLLAVSTASNFAWAEDSCTENDAACVEVGSWVVSLAVGFGERSNPVFESDDIPMLVLPSVQYYGKRFFLNTDTLGFTLVETERHMFNVIGTVSYDQMYFDDWGVGNFSFGSGASGSFSRSLSAFEGGSENFGTPTPAPTGTPTVAPTATPTMAPTATPTFAPTPSPEATFAPTPIATPTFQPTPTPIVAQGTPTPAPTATPDGITDMNGNTPTPTPTPTTVTGDGDFLSPPDGVEINFDNLHERRTSGLLGLEYTYNTDTISFGLQVLQEATKYHHGHQIRGAFTYFITGERNALALGIGAEWKDAKTLDYYFGVRPEETNTGWSYTPGEGTFSYVKVDWRYRLSRNWDLQATVQHRMFPDGVADSPLLTDDSSTAYFLGGVYRF